MRFVFPAPHSKGLRLSRSLSEWPIALRFALLVLPVCLAISLLSLWLGYRASSGALMQSIEALPLLEAKNQAGMMGEVLTGMRNSLFRIAQSSDLNPEEMRNSMGLRFQEYTDLVQEITIKKEDGSGFMLLRDTIGFAVFSLNEAALGPNSPLQQRNTTPVYPGRATLYPPVYFDEAATPGQNQDSRVPVLRMAVRMKNDLGEVILGINFSELRNRLSSVMQPDSPLRMPQQEGAMQLSFYFDVRGWILFEMDNTGTLSYLPDIAREGYTGDLGRAGYEAAFRPWAMHENFWRMVTEVAAGRAGSIPAPADKYTATHVGSTGVLCYAPVFFAPAEDMDAVPLGGIAYFETSTLPLAAFLRLANYFLALTVSVLALFGLLAWLVHRKVGQPLKNMAEELNTMTRSSTLDFVESPVCCEEQEQFKSAVNSIIARALSTRSEFEHLTREVHQNRSRQPVELATAIMPRQSADPDYGLLGSSALIREVREHVRKAARAGTDVLVWGETGTGKELVAAAIHKASARSAGPYISINCGALDENLLLDALFGHVKGAFTEARSDRKGAFLAADGGTLHLDEIANASLKVQQALLRALSVRRIRVLGTDDEVAFNTRVVAATNVDLRECVRAGTFREDLYYRLAIISIETPPLRHRKEDIPELAAFCISDAATALGRSPARLSRGALDLMSAHDWPGNVREFKNCLTRAMAFVEGDIILKQHITLEQDAFRTYAKPIAPQVLAEKIHSDATRPQAAQDLAPQTPLQTPLAAPATDFLPSAAPGNAPLAHERLWANAPVGMVPPARMEDHSLLGPQGESGVVAQGAALHAGDTLWAAQADFVKKDKNGQNNALPTDGLNERQLRALAFIHEHGELSRAEYEALVGKGLSSRTAQNDLRELVERGILQRVGAGPGTRYRIPAWH